MVKGITKRIIEINNTRSEYFDKVILFVNQNKGTYPKKFLEAQAFDCIDDIVGKSKKNKKRKSFIIKQAFIYAVLVLIGFISGGALIKILI